MSAGPRQLGRADPVDPVYLAEAETKFAVAFTKAELKAGCAQTGDAGTVESAVDSCVSNVVALLPPPPPPRPRRRRRARPRRCRSATAASRAGLAGITAAQNDVRANAFPTPSPPLDPFCWSNAAAANAQAWADGWTTGTIPTWGRTCTARTSTPQPTRRSPPPGWNPPIDAVSIWASEAADYDYATNSCSSVCGHYTQIVWRDTQAVGCGIKACTTNSPFGPSFPNWTFVVCDYDPWGQLRGAAAVLIVRAPSE